MYAAPWAMTPYTEYPNSIRIGQPALGQPPVVAAVTAVSVSTVPAITDLTGEAAADTPTVTTAGTYLKIDVFVVAVSVVEV